MVPGGYILMTLVILFLGAGYWKENICCNYIVDKYTIFICQSN